ncbi:MAG: hypothetical protein CO119_10505 [Flavobacteriales bacterium CG_4_9_14_3_um_filter_40_17]|nr:MAG: hypothetical protein CO119_10505 [Flavobacteriales bacterium CG_4_9_14_3_um_filter_40_17]
MDFVIFSVAQTINLSVPRLRGSSLAKGVVYGNSASEDFSILFESARQIQKTRSDRSAFINHCQVE